MYRRVLRAMLPILLFAQFAAAAEAPQDVDAIELKSEGFAQPLIINGDPLYRSVTSLEIAGSLQSGKGTVTLHVGEISFNDFGDAITADAAKPIEVLFERQQLPEAEQGSELTETRRLYKIKFTDDAFLNRMHLVISTNTSEPQRLVINCPSETGDRAPIQVFDLHGTPQVQDILPEPAHPRLHLAGIKRHINHGALHEVRIRGKFNGRVHLNLDPSLLEFKPFGDVSVAKAVASKSTLCLLVRRETPDPKRAGRVIYDLVTKEPQQRQYALVLAPMPLGPHRLIIRTEGEIREVVALHDPDRQRISRLYLQCGQGSPNERAAIEELIKQVGYSFDATIESKQITQLKINQANELSDLDAAIAKLPNLKRLDCTGVSLGPKGLPSLRALTHLEFLRFGHAAISDDGLKTLAPLMNLQSLHFHSCSGITDAGLPPIGKLKNLTSLQLYRDDLPEPGDPDVPRITDAGLLYLAGLTKLESLFVYGQNLTDAGLEHLSGLTNLRELMLSGDGITDAGLQLLKPLQKITGLVVQSRHTTSAGRDDLKAALPLFSEEFN